MDSGLIPKRYAKALYMVAAEHGDQEKLYRQLTLLTSAIDAEPSLNDAMRNPFVSAQDKANLIFAACQTDASDKALADFIKLLVNNRRIDMVRDIALAYQELYRKANDIYRVEVVAAAPMGQTEQDRLKQLILKHLNGGKMEYSFRVDPDLIGGFVVNIDSERLDASVANELKQLRLKFLSN